MILTVTVTDPDPERAHRCWPMPWPKVFVGYVAELETPPGKDEATIKATVVDPASEPVRHPSLRSPFATSGSA